MNARQSISGLNPEKNIVPLVIGAVVVGIVVLALSTPRDSRLSPGSTKYATLMADVQNGQVQAQLAFLATNAVDLGFGASIVEMNRSVAQEQGIKNSSGGYVVLVTAGSPADRAGIKLGDVINRINGR